MKISVILRVKNITGKACFLFSPFPDKLCQERISLSWLWLTVGPYSGSMYIGFVKTRTVSLYFLPCDWEKVWVERNWIFFDKDLYHFHRSYRTLYVYSLVYVNKKKFLNLSTREKDFNRGVFVRLHEPNRPLATFCCSSKLSLHKMGKKYLKKNNSRKLQWINHTQKYFFAQVIMNCILYTTDQVMFKLISGKSVFISTKVIESKGNIRENMLHGMNF